MTNETTRRDDADRRTEDEHIFLKLYRRLADYHGYWRDCRLAECRRMRACSGDSDKCIHDRQPTPECTQAERAEAMHDLKRRIRERLDELARQPVVPAAETDSEPRRDSLHPPR